jgi:NAD(P)-dependent dehydrogenase (short-subunit alcohol dehydrogenase family)
LFSGGPGGTRENLIAIMNKLNLFPDRDLLDPAAAAEAVVWLVSDAARNITGHALPIDAGFLAR